MNWTELFIPFSFKAWCATSFTVATSVITMTIIRKAENMEDWFSAMGRAIFTTLGVICLQGSVIIPKRLAGRIALLFILIFGVLLSTFYSASIVSTRISKPADKMNDSLYSLARSRVTVASEPYRYVDDNLESRSLTDWEVRYFHENVWSKLSSTRYVTVEEGLKNVIHGGYAYHTSPEIAYPYVSAHWDENAICDMTEIHVITPRILSFWERVDSPFTEIMKSGLIKTANMGLRRRTITRWKPLTPYCSMITRSLQSTTIFEIAPALMLVLIGITVAILIYSLEWIINKIYPTPVALEVPKARRIVHKAMLKNAALETIIAAYNSTKPAR